MYPDYDDDPDEFDTTMVDPFTGKRKRGRFEYSYEDEEPKVPRRGCVGNCATYTLVISLMMLAGIVGALAAATYFTGEQPSPTFDANATQAANFIHRTGTAIAQLPPTVIPVTSTNTPVRYPNTRYHY
jgi:hypothetical protein